MKSNIYTLPLLISIGLAACSDIENKTPSNSPKNNLESKIELQQKNELPSCFLPKKNLVSMLGTSNSFIPPQNRVNFTTDSKESTSTPLESVPIPQNLYNAIAYAETGSFENPWLRTTGMDPNVRKISTAFGPVQITKTLAQDYSTRFSHLFEPEVKEWIDSTYIPMGQKMLNGTIGYGEQVEFTDKDKEMYGDMTMAILQHLIEKSGNNVYDAAAKWRFGPASNMGDLELKDPSYLKKISSRL